MSAAAVEIRARMLFGRGYLYAGRYSAYDEGGRLGWRVVYPGGGYSVVADETAARRALIGLAEADRG
jgi:hypothetical protein